MSAQEWAEVADWMWWTAVKVIAVYGDPATAEKEHVPQEEVVAARALIALLDMAGEKGTKALLQLGEDVLKYRVDHGIREPLKRVLGG